MTAQGDALGILYLASQTPEAVFTDVVRQLAHTVADSLALSLANLRLRETLRHQSTRDPLTRLFNRRYMEETLERELRRASRLRSTVGLIMLDLDHFKHFNDTFGHAAGDTLLRELADFLRLHIRGEDVPCRYGGEEFCLILPGASLEIVQERARLLCEQAGNLKVFSGGQLLGAITLSLGVAVYPLHGATGEVVLQAADAALYRAKQQGRNRVVVA
jgi:diguanylate cyclase (GGDEF)-like protein